MDNDKRREILNTCLKGIPYVNIINPLKQTESLNLEGKIKIDLPNLESPLEFEVIIYPQYPFKNYDSESIKFLNQNLLEYKHVMGGGMVCIHTSNSIKLEEKLKIDIQSLQNWIQKYFISKDDDLHYEHLIFEASKFNQIHLNYIFTDVDYKFIDNQFGFVNISTIAEGKIRNDRSITFIAKQFLNQYGQNLASCAWSSAYNNLPNSEHGIFLFLEEAPAFHGKFLFTNWSEFKNIFKQDFLDFLHSCHKDYIKRKKQKGQHFPLFIGYKISEIDIHWQVAILEIGEFPIQGIKIDQKWITELLDGEINWSTTKNSSYKYFFGRGTFSESFINKKILIIGIGAIGSIIAHTLTKCGARSIDFCDYDRKDPENVCRSEYFFGNGITDKVEELSTNLFHISPFIEIKIVKQPLFEGLSKIFFNEPNSKKDLEDFLCDYDLIFDCSTDDDLMYVLNTLDLKNDLVNISITNKAKDMVCAFYPNIYNFVNTQYQDLLDNDLEDLYNPTGCWNPTFKASYNDINLLVQHALKILNRFYIDNSGKYNFVLSNCDDGININVKKY